MSGGTPRGRRWTAIAVGILVILGLTGAGAYDFYRTERAKWLENAPVSSLSAVYARHPEDVEIGFRLAHRLTALGKGAEAAEIMQKLVERHPNEISYWFGLARAAGSSRQPGRAEQAYLRTIELDPKSADSYSILGQMYLDAGLLQEADERFRIAAELKPPSETLLSQWAECLHRLGKHEAAWERLTRSLTQIPFQDAPYLLLGELAIRLNRSDEAIPMLERRLGLTLGYPAGVGRSPLARILVRRERPGSPGPALELAKRALKDPTPRPEFDHAYAEVLLYHRRFSEAAAAARAGLRRHPTHAGCLTALAEALKRMGRSAEAAATLGRLARPAHEDPRYTPLFEAARKHPQDGAAHRNLARALHSAGRYGDAAQVCREALERIPEDAALREQMQQSRERAIAQLSDRTPGAMRNATLTHWAEP